MMNEEIKALIEREAEKYANFQYEDSDDRMSILYDETIRDFNQVKSSMVRDDNRNIITAMIINAMEIIYMYLFSLLNFSILCITTGRAIKEAMKNRISDIPPNSIIKIIASSISQI